jgi:hypothetical protein
MRACSEMMRGRHRAADMWGTLDAEAAAYLETLTG